ncbi:hypothetical protein OGM63_21775 [Plectonema radiosum NIES-515]|uniref:Histidine kinase n=1 Tax=Plectonema radiosum NIES-515 TaxID=2986073 RepID=A0ABT3B409_9CYAN|nr:hypothetical protein [Plectonema radiosum]MCV3216106.1 hypothetical protein [Plectonema radiosum NIES-515]
MTKTDNSQAMSEEIKQKIFDHLFITKAVSKGTGLGLAIAISNYCRKTWGNSTGKFNPRRRCCLSNYNYRAG